MTRMVWIVEKQDYAPGLTALIGAHYNEADAIEHSKSWTNCTVRKFKLVPRRKRKGAKK